MARRADLSTSKRNRVVQFILGGCIDGNPPRGKLKEARLKFGISRQTVTRLWGAAKKQQANGEMIHLKSGKINYQRRKEVFLDITLLTSLEYTKRSTIRSLAVALGISKSTVGRWVLAGLIRAHTSALKPDLTAPNKLLRLRFSLEALELDRILNKIKFRNMYNTVHIDEKWFYITRGSHKFYLAPGEPEPHRTCKSKKFIGKIMFMCAVSMPLFTDNGEVLFDGKIGIFPFTMQVPAKRNSRNRPAETLETKPIESITKQVIRECLINQILPAIKAKWPEGASKNINIQQDNARSHIKDSDPEWRAAAMQSGFNIKLIQQPPNSPDTNVNDLGWFRAIQSLQVQTASKTMDDLLNAVCLSFEELCPISLNNVFLSLYGCMIEIMKLKGNNCYTIPHMAKGALIRADKLPISLEVPMELIIQCLNYLKDMGSNEGVTEIMEAMGLDIEGY